MDTTSQHSRRRVLRTPPPPPPRCSILCFSSSVPSTRPMFSVSWLEEGNTYLSPNSVYTKGPESYGARCKSIKQEIYKTERGLKKGTTAQQGKAPAGKVRQRWGNRVTEQRLMGLSSQAGRSERAVRGSRGGTIEQPCRGRPWRSSQEETVIKGRAGKGNTEAKRLSLLYTIPVAALSQREAQPSAGHGEGSLLTRAPFFPT